MGLDSGHREGALTGFATHLTGHMGHALRGKHAGYELRCWITSAPSLLERLPEARQDRQDFQDRQALSASQQREMHYWSP